MTALSDNSAAERLARIIAKSGRLAARIEAVAGLA